MLEYTHQAMEKHVLIAQKTRWLIQVVGMGLMVLLFLSLHPTPSIFGQSFIGNAAGQLRNALAQVTNINDTLTLDQLREQAQRVLDVLDGSLSAEAANIPLKDDSVRRHLINFWEQQSIELVRLINTYGPTGEVPVSHQRLMMVVNVVLIRLGQAEHWAHMVLLTKNVEAAQRYLQNLKLTLQQAVGSHSDLNEAGADFIEKTLNKVAHLSQSKWPSLFNFEKPSNQVASE